jgi:putative transposon-encoded protein
MGRKMQLPPVKEITTEVSKIGTGAHVFVPKEWLQTDPKKPATRVRVILLDEDEKES